MKVATLSFGSFNPHNVSWDDICQSSYLTRQNYKMPCWMKVAILIGKKAKYVQLAEIGFSHVAVSSDKDIKCRDFSVAPVGMK